MYDKELNIAIEAAKKAGEFLLKREGIHIDQEEGKDIKLSSDKTSEGIIVACLSETGIPVLSEECGLIGPESDYLWIVDPLDGTVNYFKGMDDLSCVSIALWKGDEPVLGVVNKYVASEVFWGVVGEGAFLNGVPISPSHTTRLEQAVLATGFPVNRDYSSESLAGFIRQVQQFKKVRMLGSATLMATYVSMGKVDAYIEEGIMLWDIAAAMAIAAASGAAMKLEKKDRNRCVYKCFANKCLMDDYDAKSL